MDSFASNRKWKGRRARAGRLAAWGATSLVAASISWAPGAALAADGLDTAKEGGLGAAAAITSLVYGPVKVFWAAGGSVISGLAWVFTAGDGEVAQTVLTRAVRGTYVITPETLQGGQEIEFVGRSPQYRPASRPASVASAPEPDGW